MIEEYAGREVLLDTHVLIWASLAPEKLSSRARGILESGRYEVLISSATIWEMVIKTEKGKWQFDDPAKLVFSWAKSLGARWLSIDARHIQALTRLPLLHKDPFDRILLAQAARERIALITADKDLHRYRQLKEDWLPGAKPWIIW